MAAAETLVRNRIKSVVETEFAAEGIVVDNDKLPRAAGYKGSHEAAVYPVGAREVPGRVIELNVTAVLQLYHKYEANIDEHQVVDPGIIEGWADRLRRAFKTNSVGTGEDFWFLRLTNIEYPDDPTGNRSRLEATFEARMENPASC